MNLKDVQRVLKAKILVGEEFMDRQAETCCGSDLMSDVLAFTKCNTLLCTGLTNIQVIRTAGITDLCGIVIVRGKVPSPDFLNFAREAGMPVLSTGLTLFEACGLLYVAGLRGCSQEGGCSKPAAFYMWQGCAAARRKGAAPYDGSQIG